MSRERWEQLTRGVPVLLYHAFAETDVSDRYVVARRALSRQLRLLRLLGYHGIHFDELVEAIRRSRLPPRRAVVITIDDGYTDNLEIAQPVLSRHGFPFTIFLVSGGWGRRRLEPRRSARRPASLSPAQVEGLSAKASASALTPGPTRTFPSFRSGLEPEIAGSRRDLEERIGSPVDVFAYPYGELDDRAVDAVHAAGFAGAGTTQPRLVGLDEDPYLLPRIEVRSTDSLLRVALHVLLGVH